MCRGICTCPCKLDLRLSLKRMFMLLIYEQQSLHTRSNQRSGHLRGSDPQPPSSQNVWTSVSYPGSRDGHVGMHQGAWRINVMPNDMNRKKKKDSWSLYYVGVVDEWGLIERKRSFSQGLRSDFCYHAWSIHYTNHINCWWARPRKWCGNQCLNRRLSNAHKRPEDR